MLNYQRVTTAYHSNSYPKEQYCIRMKRNGTKGQNSDLRESSNQLCLYSTMLGWCRPNPAALQICKLRRKMLSTMLGWLKRKATKSSKNAKTKKKTH